MDLPFGALRVEAANAHQPPAGLKNIVLQLSLPGTRPGHLRHARFPIGSQIFLSRCDRRAFPIAIDAPPDFAIDFRQIIFLARFNLPVANEESFIIGGSRGRSMQSATKSPQKPQRYRNENHPTLKHSEALKGSEKRSFFGDPDPRGENRPHLVALLN